MPAHRLRFAAALWLVLTATADAGVLYVDLNSTNAVPPFANWSTAATTIQDAIDAASPGDQVLVTNGVYQAGGRVVSPYLLTNRIVVNKPISVQSVNGPAVTSIQGKRPLGTNAVRCAFLSNGAVLAGFSLTNGGTRLVDTNFDATYHNQSGAGVWCETTNEVVSNCVVVGNVANFYAGGANYGTLNNCVLTANSAYTFGGALGSRLNGCLLSNNTAFSTGGAAGKLNNCILVGNVATGEGGGGADVSVLINCVLRDNHAPNFGGGAHSSTLINCVLTGNSAFYGGGAQGCALINCVVTGNSGSQGGGTDTCTNWNCIVYFNSAPKGSNYWFTYGPNPFFNSCTAPIPDEGINNFTNAPFFMDQANGDFRLQSNSPCINAGNNTSAPAGPDLAGNPRIAGGTVDMGAYEFQFPTSAISYAWLQQFGLATDGTADSADPDSDSMNNWQEWRAGTIPTNGASRLLMLNPTPGVSNMVVAWQSVTNRTYYLQRAVNLAAQGAFFPLATNIVGQNGATSFTDTNTSGPGPFFYRVGVQ